MSNKSVGGGKEQDPKKDARPQAGVCGGVRITRK